MVKSDNSDLQPYTVSRQWKKEENKIVIPIWFENDHRNASIFPTN